MASKVVLGRADLCSATSPQLREVGALAWIPEGLGISHRAGPPGARLSRQPS